MPITMISDDGTSLEEPPEILETLWQNWQQADGGGGHCKGCPAHWSLRSDIDGKPGKRKTSFQHRPFCGDGSFDPDIVIMPREPGPPRDEKTDRNKRHRTLEEVRNQSIADSPGGSIEHTSPLFEAIETSEFEGHFTQIRKCNELNQGDNSQARKQCAGTGGYQGYLYDEIEALDPEYIITITREGQNEFCEVFDLEQMDTVAMASGDTSSGFRTARQERLGFIWIPLPHPDPRGASQVYNRLNPDLNPEEYFELVADEVLEFIRSNK
jgi:hypothetical protein